MTDKPIPKPLHLKTLFAQDATFPIYHVNVANVRFSTDEFFLTLGVVIPPETAELITLGEDDYVEARPLFRCALTRQAMEWLLETLATQYDQQSQYLEAHQGTKYAESEEESP